MQGPNPERIIRLAAPMLETWMRADPSHRALVAEIAKYLTDLSASPADTRRGPPAIPDARSVTNITPATVVPPASVAPPVVAAPPTSQQRTVTKGLDKMFTQAHTLAEGLVGGLDAPPPAAPGVVVPVPPPPPTPPIKVVPAQPSPDERQLKEQRLLLQKARHHRVMIDKCVAAKDFSAAGGHVGRVADALAEFVEARGSMSVGDDGRTLLDETLDAIGPRFVMAAAAEKRLDALLQLLDAREERGDDHPVGPAASVRQMLAGKVGVIIGGDVREARRAALEHELGFGELRWVRSTPTMLVSKYAADIKRPEVDLVLVAIRWVRHGGAFAAADAAIKHGKMLVRIPGGLGINSVAQEILDQAGRRGRIEGLRTAGA